jgi:MerR family transcriptional regulator/heat shock protein HspR
MQMDGFGDRGLYGISVASELTGVAPQNLRVYESRGLLEPQRTPGGTRRYSDSDVARIARIASLLEQGLNLAGIGHVLELEAETRRLKAEVRALRRAVAASGRPAAGSHAGPDAGQQVPG